MQQAASNTGLNIQTQQQRNSIRQLMKKLPKQLFLRRAVKPAGAVNIKIQEGNSF